MRVGEGDNHQLALVHEHSPRTLSLKPYAEAKRKNCEARYLLGHEDLLDLLDLLESETLYSS